MEKLCCANRNLDMYYVSHQKGSNIWYHISCRVLKYIFEMPIRKSNMSDMHEKYSNTKYLAFRYISQTHAYLDRRSICRCSISSCVFSKFQSDHFFCPHQVLFPPEIWLTIFSLFWSTAKKDEKLATRFPAHPDIFLHVVATLLLMKKFFYIYKRSMKNYLSLVQ